MKNLVFCSDGTRNTPKDRTNVYQLYNMLDESPSQVKAYDKGIGTKFGNVIRGCAFGAGLFNNVLDGYRFLSENYESGDRIYLFGFSRGAYTVRSLASMVCMCGLAPAGSTGKVSRKFWRAYKANRKSSFPSMLDELRSEYGLRKALIEAVCVWDTVGSIGRQTRTRDIRKKLRHRYHRMSVPVGIRRIYHAVSIDERRTQFYPHLLHNQVESIEDTSVEEVWFAGVHSDIGGGYRDSDSALGDITLKWMISHVSSELAFDQEALESLNPDPLGKMHNTEGGIIFSFFRKKNRPVRRGSVLHQSVIERIAEPPHEYQQHREPSGNYSPHALTFCSFSAPPSFGIEVNYRISTKINPSSH